MFYKKKILKNPILLTGMKNSGKSLVFPFLESLEIVNSVTKNFIFNQIIHLYFAKKISKEAALILLRNILDFTFYDSMLGRDLNLRFNDETSIWRSFDPKENFKKIFNHKNYNLFSNYKDLRLLIDTHNAVNHYEIWSTLFSNIKIINVQRSPVSTIYSWIRDKLYSDKSLNSKITQLILFKDKNYKAPIPLQIFRYKNHFCKNNYCDRSVIVFENLKKDEIYSLETIPKKNILNIQFEDFLLNPNKEILKINKFLKYTILKDYSNLFIREKVPRDWSINDEYRKLDILKKKLSPKYYNKVNNLFSKWLDVNGK